MRTQAHLKPINQKAKKLEAECSVFQPIEQSSDMQTLKQSDHNKSDSMNNQEQSYSRPKRDMKLPVKLDLWSIMWLVW